MGRSDSLTPCRHVPFTEITRAASTKIRQDSLPFLKRVDFLVFKFDFTFLGGELTFHILNSRNADRTEEFLNE